MWLGLILGSPYLLLKALFGNHGVGERFGYIRTRKTVSPLIWFHAASVGELKNLASLIPAISGIDRNLEFAISTTTITGKRRAIEIFGDKAGVFLQPLELKSAIRRAARRLNPTKLILVETELWPLMIYEISAMKIPIFLVNARMSSDSFRKYRMSRFLFSPLVRKFRMIFAQTEDDEKRFRMLGADHVEVAGNLKYDQALSEEVPVKSRLNIDAAGKLIFVAGSIRKGEDEILADVIIAARELGMNFGFILVPRHMKKLNDVAATLEKKGIEYKLRSKIDRQDISLDCVLLVDTMGELRDFYALADLAFVGGSMVPIGGHDPLEPAAIGKPVVFGPFMENAREAAENLLESGGAATVESREDLIAVLRRALSDPNELKLKGELCRKTILSMAGASEKVARYVVEGTK